MYSLELPVRKGSIYSGELPASTFAGKLGHSEKRMADPFTGTAPTSRDDEGAGRLEEDPCESSMGSKRLQLLVHVLAAFLCLSTTVDIYKGTLFCWHPICMTLGFVGLLVEGVVLAVNFRQLEGSRRVAAIQLHALLQGAAVLVVAGGFWAIWQNKVRWSLDCTCLPALTHMCAQ